LRFAAFSAALDLKTAMFVSCSVWRDRLIGMLVGGGVSNTKIRRLKHDVGSERINP
jgi:hypothetical protein